jgi:gamma-glutamylcyclotransferase (GGCT)/AIG2-like uncharacterized protein YtfP
MPNLFAYGMLMNDFITKRVTGRVFPKKRAVLENYEKIMPGTGYSYILPRAGSIVEGYILYGLDDDTLAKVDRYEAEGDLYERKEVEVNVQGRYERAYTYVGNPHGLRKFFGPEVHTDVRIKEYLERKLKDLTDLEDQESTDLIHRAKAELLSDRIEALVSAHFRKSADLRYLIDKLLYKPTFPTLEKVKSDPEALKYADEYIKLVVKHVIFNQLEHMIGNSFAGEIAMPSPFYERTLSNLIALIFMNRKTTAIERIMKELGADRLSMDKEYLDYTGLAIRIADVIFDRIELKEITDWVIAHRRPGKIPLGVEIEMSNIGAKAVDAEPGEDPKYDSFYYFNDFDLSHRCWKLGGHVDDHSGIEDHEGHTRGFFEYSLGKLGVAGDFSKPVTDDPWVLNQLINQSVLFADILPHSFHITLDTRDEPDMSRLNDPELLICLLLLCGDIELDERGYPHENRICNCEIIDKYGRLHFSDENVHFASEEDEEEGLIERSRKINLIEYKFMRLRSNRNYEPFILALKGFQLGYNPRPLGSTFRSLDEFSFPEVETLRKWAEKPWPLPDTIISEFLRLVRKGLMEEDDGRPAHPVDYIEGNLKKLERMLSRMNELISSTGRRI